MDIESIGSMWFRWRAIACCAVLGWGGAASPVAASADDDGRKTPVAQSAPASASDAEAAVSQRTLEKRFELAMTGARLEGVWQMTAKGALDAGGALSEPLKDSYVISKVTKLDGDRWLVFARITFADKDVNIPVPVRVVWAGDTAVITLDDLGVPLIGTYSARVMIHHGFYSGIWYSNVKHYGGVMAGRIIKDVGETKTAPVSSDTEDAPRDGD